MLKGSVRREDASDKGTFRQEENDAILFTKEYSGVVYNIWVSVDYGHVYIGY